MMERLLDRFAKSPLGRKLEAEQHAEDTGKRREWAAHRLRVRADHDRRLPALRAAQADAEARERALEADLIQAREARAVASLAAMTAGLQFDVQDGSLARQLRATADPKIRALKWRLMARADAARTATRTISQPGPLDPVTMQRAEIWGTNAPENARVLAAALAAGRLLDELELEILEDDALVARLAAIEATVPAPTDAVPTTHMPEMTPGESREFGWRMQREQEARR
jgi:hypothetical protein